MTDDKVQETWMAVGMTTRLRDTKIQYANEENHQVSGRIHQKITEAMTFLMMYLIMYINVIFL